MNKSMVHRSDASPNAHLRLPNDIYTQSLARTSNLLPNNFRNKKDLSQLHLIVKQPHLLSRLESR